MEIVAQAGEQSGHVGIRFGVNILILDRPPQALYEAVVQEPAATIHTDANIGRLQFGSETMGREMHTLVGIEDFRLAQLQCLAQGGQT